MSSVRQQLTDAFSERILVLDGAMGTAIQDLRLTIDEELEILFPTMPPPIPVPNCTGPLLAELGAPGNELFRVDHPDLPGEPFEAQVGTLLGLAPGQVPLQFEFHVEEAIPEATVRWRFSAATSNESPVTAATFAAVCVSSESACRLPSTTEASVDAPATI